MSRTSVVRARGSANPTASHHLSLLLQVSSILTLCPLSIPCFSPNLLVPFLQDLLKLSPETPDLLPRRESYMCGHYYWPCDSVPPARGLIHSGASVHEPNSLHDSGHKLD